MVLVFAILEQLSESFGKVDQNSLPVSIQSLPHTLVTHNLQYSADYGFSYAYIHFPIFEDKAHQFDHHLNQNLVGRGKHKADEFLMMF